jgi:hypothetical protein
MTTSNIFSVPLLCLTPLYHFSSDVSELVVNGNIRICRFDDCRAIPFDEPVAGHFRLREPDYLLCHVPFVSQPSVLAKFTSLLAAEKYEEASEIAMSVTVELFAVLRLFKPGHLRAGDTFLLVHSNDKWGAASSFRASAMTIDYGLLSSEITSYTLNSTEIPFFRAFRDSLLPALRNTKSIAPLANALILYGDDKQELSNIIYAVTILETLLTKSGETEGLTYRLSMRAANLLGNDAVDRKAIFQQVKDFYHLRSRLAHGDFDSRTLTRLNEVGPLRETIRRVLLSVIALFSEGVVAPASLPDLLDEFAFDDEKRKQVQATASKFLHISAEKTSSAEARKE